MRMFTAIDLVIVGEGRSSKAVARTARETQNIDYIGRLSHKELAPYYRNAIAVILPSLVFETFGLVIIEAFSVGTPVLARRIGAYEELIERSGGGLLFKSVDTLGAAMKSIVENEELRAELAARGQEAVRQWWTERNVVPQYLQIIRRTAEAKFLQPKA